MPTGMLSKALKCQPQLRPLHKLLLVIIADRSANDEICTKTLPSLAMSCGVPAWEANAAVRTLIHNGYLVMKTNGMGDRGYAFTEDV